MPAVLWMAGFNFYFRKFSKVVSDSYPTSSTHPVYPPYASPIKRWELILMHVNPKPWGEIMFEAREELGLTPIELSDAADVPVSYIVGVEMGWKGLPFDDMLRICRALGVSME